MSRIYKFHRASIIFFAAMLFFVSVNAQTNTESKVNLLARADNTIQTKPKFRTKMSDSIIGVWSGRHITLEISENGADVEYDCATGKISKKIMPDKNHRFDVSGTYAEEHGGPVRMDEQANGLAVKYKGQIKGKKMTLTVVRADNKKPVGTFTLIFGREPTLVKCK